MKNNAFEKLERKIAASFKYVKRDIMRLEQEIYNLNQKILELTEKNKKTKKIKSRSSQKDL